MNKFETDWLKPPATTDGGNVVWLKFVVANPYAKVHAGPS